MRSAAPGSSGRSGQQRILAETGFQFVIEKIPERQVQGIAYIRKNLDCGVLFSQLHIPKVALGDTGKGCKPVDAVLFCISEIAVLVPMSMMLLPLDIEIG